MALDGKVALVTGSTSGIGLGIARALAQKGCKLILTGLADQKLIDELTEEFSRYQYPARFVPCDLRSKNSIKEFCQEVTSQHPNGVDILVNNAGIQHVCNIEDYPDEKWEDMMAITVTAPFRFIKHFIPAMKNRGWGKIINIASMMGIVSQEGKAPYSAAKSAVIGLTKGVSLEAAPFGVTCNAVCPAFVNTPLIAKQIEKFSKEESIPFEEAQKRFFERQPTNKPVEIQEIADLVIFLCSPSADSITGSPLLIDAGYTAR